MNVRSMGISAVLAIAILAACSDDAADDAPTTGATADGGQLDAVSPDIETAVDSGTHGSDGAGDTAVDAAVDASSTGDAGHAGDSAQDDASAADTSDVAEHGDTNAASDAGAADTAATDAAPELDGTELDGTTAADMTADPDAGAGGDAGSRAARLSTPGDLAQAQPGVAGAGSVQRGRATGHRRRRWAAGALRGATGHRAPPARRRARRDST